MKAAILSLALVALASAKTMKWTLADLETIAGLETIDYAIEANETTNSCGAFRGVEAGGKTNYTAATGIYTVPKLSARTGHDWKARNATTPRVIISVGIDGIMCPDTVRAGTYSTISQTGAQTNQPFLQFNGLTRIARTPMVNAGDPVAVQILVSGENTAIINWENQNTYEQFSIDVDTKGLCYKTVSWQVQDIPPTKANPGEYFAAFEPVKFSFMQGERADGVSVKFDGKAEFLKDEPWCKGAQTGVENELVVTSL